MSKLSRKRKRLPGPLTSTQVDNIPSATNSLRPPPKDRNEEFFLRQLETAINESKNNANVQETAVYCICNGEEMPGMIGCDFCDEWYHPHCLNLTKDEVIRLSNENWSCPKCDTNKDDDAAVQIDKQAMSLKSSEDIPKSLAPAIPVIKKSPLKLTDNISKTQSKSDFASEKLLMPKSSKAIQISKNSSNILDGDKDLLLLTSNNDLHKTTAKVANVIKESPIRLTKSAPKSKTRTSFIADNGNASKQNEICNTSPANAKTNKDELSIQSVESTVKTPLHDASVSRSLSVPRKWTPPAMIASNTKSVNSRNVLTSPSSTTKNSIAQLTPRLRVGLTRNFKSPKPLHASLKWTP